jgi:hypothetical protein
MKTSCFKICTACFIVLLFAGTLYAQTTSIQLSTAADSLSNYRVLNSDGTTRLRVNSDGGFYVEGEFGTGVIPKTNWGTRMMWYPAKAAFRAGIANLTNWDPDSVGNYSFAAGYNPKAKGVGSAAIGYATIATGTGATALGYSTTASGHYSTSMGNGTLASGMYSLAVGSVTTAGGNCSFASGFNTTASGFISTAMGSYVSTNGYSGSFVIGDVSTTTTTNSTGINLMTMRFNNGYVLYTDSACVNYAYLAHNATAWTFSSDRKKKENFCQIDGEQILTKIREMPITEWNYKGTDASVKYIGPVAQDFYSAFHLGGTDSLGINTLCIDGVNIAAIQALEKRTAELQKANEKIATMEKRIEKLEQIISSSTTNNK